MLTGKKIPAQKAYELGFISAVVNDEQELDAKVNEYVEELLSSAPVAMKDIKQLVNYVSAHPHEDNLKEVTRRGRPTILDLWARVTRSERVRTHARCRR